MCVMAIALFHTISLGYVSHDFNFLLSFDPIGASAPAQGGDGRWRFFPIRLRFSS